MFRGYSEETVGRNIALLEREGRPRAQAIAIALSEARTAWRRKHPTGVYPEHLRMRKKGGRKMNPTKRVVRKRVGTSTTKLSMRTGAKPDARLRRRRRKNTDAGYYPNPAKRISVVHATQPRYIVGMKDGTRTVYVSTVLKDRPIGGDTEKRNAMRMASMRAKEIARALHDEFPTTTVFVLKV